MCSKIVIAICLLAATAGAWHPNLVAWYRAENNALDASGNGHHGTWVGTEAYAPGVFAQGFAASSLSQWVSTPVDALFIENTLVFTLSAWLYIPDIDGDFPPGQFRLFNSFGGASAQKGIALQVDNRQSSDITTRAIRLVVGQGTAGNYLLIVEGGLDSATPGWTHYAAVGDGSVVRLYRNGSEIAHGEVSTPLPEGPSQHDLLLLSSTIADAERYIDDLRIFNAALSPSDIKRVMLGLMPLGRY